mgnify:CR=1 FL=1
MQTKLLVIDEQEMFRTGLCKMLAQLPWISDIKETGNMKLAYLYIKEYSPNIILFNPYINDNTYYNEIPKMKDISPNTKITILTDFANVEDILDSAKYGASGFFLKQTPFKEFEMNLYDIMNGQYRISMSLSTTLYEGISNVLQNKNLTKREVEIFELVSKGYSNKEIASKLFISTNTVKNHISNIMQKKNYTSRYQMIAKFRDKYN